MRKFMYNMKWQDSKGKWLKREILSDIALVLMVALGINFAIWLEEMI